MYDKIMSIANELEEKIVNQRRDFHKYAESGWFEMRTSSIIAGKLRDMGYEVLTGSKVCSESERMGLPSAEELHKHYEWAKAHGADERYIDSVQGGFTGVVAILDCGAGPVVAMRFDIDALGVVESTDENHLPNKLGFASVNEGVMHACGHDGHASIGLGVAEVLMGLKNSLHGKIKIIFQPAEEGVRGARAVVENGHLDGADYFLAAHISEKDDKNDYDLIPGSYGSLATTKYDMYFKGKPAHAGGSPEEGNNVMLSLATAILNLHSIPRNSKGASRINVGKAIAGTGRNVIPDQAMAEIEVRGETDEVNKYMEEYALRIIKSAAEMHGTTCEIKCAGSSQSLESDEAFAERIKDICGKNLKEIKISNALKSKNSGSEDVSYMMKRVQQGGGQASYMRILTDVRAPGHTREFDFDEEVLVKGIKIFSAIVYDILKNNEC